MTDEEHDAQTSLDAPKSYSFVGSYDYSIDAKGRIIVPIVYREQLGEGFVIAPTRKYDAIGLYPKDVYQRELAALTSLNQRYPVVQDALTQFTKLTFLDNTPDAQGRLLLPSKIRQRMLGDAKDLEISGNYDHVRIVDGAKAQAEDHRFMENLDEILKTLAELSN